MRFGDEIASEMLRIYKFVSFWFNDNSKTMFLRLIPCQNVDVTIPMLHPSFGSPSCYMQCHKYHHRYLPLALHNPALDRTRLAHHTLAHNLEHNLCDLLAHTFHHSSSNPH